MTLVILILIIILLGSAFFAGIETGFVSLDLLRLEKESHKKENKRLSKKANLILRLVKSPDKFLGTSLIGNNIALVLFTTLFTTYFVDMKNFFSEETGPLITTFFILLFGEIIPKSLFRNYSHYMLNRSISLFKFFYILFTPLRFFIIGINSLLEKIILRGNYQTEDKYSLKDLNFLFSQTSKDQKLLPEQRKMVKDTLEFRKLTTKNVMTPRTEVSLFEKNDSIKQILPQISDSGFSRYPVYEEKIDDIVGILIVHDLLREEFDENFQLKNIIRPATFIPENADLSVALFKMKKNKVSMCVVVDSYGGFSGIISIEDILEEIVGEIEDEYDSKVESENIKKIGKNSYLVNGDIEIENLEKIDIYLPTGDYETVAGLILEHFSEIPSKGKTIKLNRIDIEVISSDNRRIKQVKLTRKKK